MSAKVICVVNDFEIFDKVVKNNENLKGTELFFYDNTSENISITKRYNQFIEENIGRGDSVAAPEQDFWCAFIHQDFGIQENINPLLEKLNKDCIYGAVGIKIFRGLFYGKKGGVNVKYGFKTQLKLTLGRILQGNNDFNFKKHGRIALFQPTVDVIDCCCIMIHSSLIKKYNLRFDENLDFHMYAEELCYRAKQDYKIKTKVVQLKCFHMNKGSLNEEFKKSAQYLKGKFKIKYIPSTCPNQD